MLVKKEIYSAMIDAYVSEYFSVLANFKSDGSIGTIEIIPAEIIR